MTSLDDLPMHHPDESIATRNGASGRKRGRNPNPDPATSRRGRANRSRGNRAELDVARSIPGGRKMGPLGLPWDVEVGTYARLQVKKLAARPSAKEIRRIIERIPATGDRLRGFVWVEAAGQGKRGQRLVWFTVDEFADWHGIGKAAGWATTGNLVMMPLADWVAEFVSVGLSDA